MSDTPDAFTLSNLRITPEKITHGRPAHLTWDTTAGSAQYTVRYAGPKTPLVTINPTDKGHVPPTAKEWDSPPLDDWVVVFTLTAQVQDDYQTVAATVFVDRGDAEFGDLDAKGIVRLLAAPQYLFDDVVLVDRDGTHMAVSGTFEGQQISQPKSLHDIFGDGGRRTYTAPSDGILTLRTNTPEGSSGTENEMTMLVTVGPPTPPIPAALAQRTGAPPPFNDRVKEWTITAHDSLTLPIAAGTTLDLDEPSYDGGQRGLTVHWSAFGGPNPLRHDAG
ncbi:hypothetical protein [Streptomyces tsukubensis]|uniref:Uncharacterized protein n=1 Tax=Streptomyces tsukubensis TaxID=83656 RepID=A0A1V4A509_9ACTN|nr:hypothetical protein [Streptomyces tsukubensis]OON76201.1 hypothetical protein B1H18_21505 [Streptomyces tsukubensis]QFR93724.1 hypothetical protein GBW32_12320 [Streptomyces tsukubensis]